MTVTIQSVCERWSSPTARPLFKGNLIDESGCCCAQGDILRMQGVSDEELRSMKQSVADKRVAKELGISTFQSVLLRQINDTRDGCPQAVLSDINSILGPHANLILAFGYHLDSMSDAALSAAGNAAWFAAGNAAWSAAWSAARDAAWFAAGNAAWPAARDAAGNAARSAARDAAGNAAEELCGWSELKSDPYFLPMFGISDPVAWVEAIDPQANRLREENIKKGQP